MLNNKFKIIKNDDGSRAAQCTIRQKRFKYHHSTSTLKYHLENKHPFNRDVLKTEEGQQELTNLLQPAVASRPFQSQMTKTMSIGMWKHKAIKHH